VAARQTMAATNKCMAWKSKSRARGNAKGQHCHSPPFGGARPHDISLHDPELYYFLSLLTGIAALLASLYEFSRPGRRKRAKPLDVVDQPQVKPPSRAVPLDRGQQDVGPSAAQRDPSLPTEEKHTKGEN